LKIYFKYMVSQRCKMLVSSELDKLGLDHEPVELGYVVLLNDATQEQLDALSENLRPSGLQLLDDRRNILVERIKNVIIEMVHYCEELPKENYSSYISKQIGLDYTYLSNVFSEVKGITIQQFIIMHKIEKVKEMMIYDGLSLKEISYRLNYSSVGHLSNQFKKVTGLSPSLFRKLQSKRMKSLEDL
jgi:AraC-like DNA-binding protein